MVLSDRCALRGAAIPSIVHGRPEVSDLAEIAMHVEAQLAAILPTRCRRLYPLLPLSAFGNLSSLM